jgi:hypothetical protein
VDVQRAVAPDISLRIAGSFASLRIIGWNRDSVVVTGTLPKAARFEAYFGTSTTALPRGAKMYVESPNDQSASGGTLELHVPLKARVWAKSGTADIDVTGVTGGLDLNVVGGSVHVSASPRELNVESMDGGVTVDGSPDWVRLKTGAGDITMRGGSADAAFTTVSGTVRVNDGALERARFESVSGNIDFGSDLATGADITFDTHSGAIDLRLRARPDVDIDAATIAGSIENQLSFTRPSPGRDGRGQELGVSLGSGHSRIVVRTFKGNIRLASR